MNILRSFFATLADIAYTLFQGAGTACWWAQASRVTLRVFAYTLYKHSDRFSSLLSPRNLPGCLVGSSGLEPPTSCLSGMRSNLLSYEPVDYLGVFFSHSLAPLGGDEGIRTPDPLLAGQVLSQLSYTPSVFFFTGVFYSTIPEN